MTTTMRNIDHRDFSGAKKPDQANMDRKWWLKDGEELAQGVASVVQTLVEFDGRRQTQYQISARLYGNMSLMGVNGLALTKGPAQTNAVKDRVTYNLIQSTADTVTAKLCKNKPKPMFLTSGGDWKKQRRAKKLNKFMDGVFYENKAHALGALVLRDGCVFGDGVIHVFKHHSRVRYERVLASELFVDQVEAFYGEPRQMHRPKIIDRAVALDLWPKKAAAIRRENSASKDMSSTYQNVADQIRVIESWRLPSGPDAGDGRHTITLANSVLFEEKWEKDYFPFAFFKWSPRLHGFWAQALAEQLQNLQSEINKILWVIQRSMHLAGSFKILREKGSQIVKEHLNNEIGTIVDYVGKEPSYVVPPCVPPEVYAHLATLIQRGFEQAGVSQLSAASSKPAGLDSGKALRTMVDIESDRFQTVGQAYEQLYLDLVTPTVDCIKEIAEEEGGYKVKSPGKRSLDEIDWADVELEDDDYTTQVFPISSLPDTPEGRLQTVTEYAQAGYLDQRQAKRLLAFPDLEQVESLSAAAEEYLEKILDAMVDDGKTARFELAYDNAQLAREMALEYYARGKTQGMDDDRLQLLRDFLADIDEQEQAAAAAAAPPQDAAMPAAPTGPAAVPAPPPVSPLLPNAPQVAA